MFIYLGNQKCGNTYKSCIGNPSKPLETHIVVIIVLCIVIPSIVIVGCAYYCRIYRIKRARARIARQIQDIALLNRQQMIYFISRQCPTNIEPLIQEIPPPTYEQAQIQKTEH